MSETAGALPPEPAALVRLTRRQALREFVDDAGLHWQFRDTQGPGPALLLLPGAAGGADVAYQLVDALGQRVRGISVTYPGGASAVALADGLAQLLDRLEVDRAALWGSSYGAWWAQAFAVRHAARVDALWLGNTFVDGDDVAHIPLFDRAWLTASSADAVQQAWLQATRNRPPSELRDLLLHFIGRTLPPDNLRGRLIEVASAQALPAATGIERTVVCSCDDDPVIGAYTRERVAARYPRARHVRLTAGGHYPHLTNTQALLVELRHWLDS